jgi:hypothetical protein
LRFQDHRSIELSVIIEIGMHCQIFQWTLFASFSSK